MRTKIFKKIYALFVLMAIAATFLFGNIASFVTTRAAQSAVVSYDHRSIYDDLSDFGCSPEPSPNLPEGNVQPLFFMEYGYSENGYIAQQYYGLYVYVYNPTGKSVKNDGNVVKMATAYDGEEVKSYENVSLRLLDATNDNLLLKFKVENAYMRFYSLEKKYAAGNDEKERRYDIASIQLTHQETEDNAFSKTFYFSGFSAGCGASTSSESTLKSRSEGLETIELNVGHTNYRTDVFVDNVCDELNTVYFSVPKRYFENYGGLQKIKATWEEFKTLPVFVTNEKAAYDALLPYLFQDIGDRTDELTYRVLWDMYLDYTLQGQYPTSYMTFRNAYNRLTGGSLMPDYSVWDSITTAEKHYWADKTDEGEAINDVTCMAWLFYREDAEFDADEVTREDWRVSAAEMEAWYKKYRDKELFADSIDADRVEYLDDKTATRGRITQEIDADETKDLLFEENQSWWDKLWHGVEYEGKPYSPIVTFKSVDDLGVSNAEDFAEKYYVNEKDADTVYKYVKDELAEGNYPVLFRFAQTDYYATNAYFDSEENKNFTSCDGYVAQETVFLDFDIISLTFRDKSGNDTVIGVVSNPIDIINGLDAPTNIPTKDETWDWRKILTSVFFGLLALGLVIGLIVLIVKLGVNVVIGVIGVVLKWIGKLVLWLLKGLWWLIKQPFIGIGKLFKLIFCRE